MSYSIPTRPLSAKSRAVEMAGKKFNRLLFLEFIGSNEKGLAIAKFLCDCGKEITCVAARVRYGTTKSCGCQKHDSTVARNIAAGHPATGTRLFRIWNRMHQRCEDVNCDDYKDYGGRGIMVCDQWSEFNPFAEWANKNGYSDDLSIDRILVNGIYEPDNCRWATAIMQGRNKRNNRIITHNGESKTLSEWAQIHNVSHKKITYRIDQGWSMERVFANL